MSSEAFAIALHHSRAKGATLLVLIGIANHDGDGGSWPSIRTLAKYARCSERQVTRAIAELESLHEIRRVIQRGGTADAQDWRRPNLYHFDLTCPPDCDGTKNHRTIRDSREPLGMLNDERKRYTQTYPQRVTPMSPGDTHVTGPGDAHVTLTRQVITNNSSTKSNHSTRVGSCGHELLPDTGGRHCRVGCPTQEVKPA